MKKVKKVLYIIMIGVILIIVGYFVTSYTQFKGNIKQETFKNAFFRTKDESGFVSFGSFKNTVLCINNKYYYISDVIYDNGIFTFEDRDNEESYKIGVINKDMIYSSDFNTYFYNITLFNK